MTADPGFPVVSKRFSMVRRRRNRSESDARKSCTAPGERAGIYRLRAVLGVEADRRGHLRACAGARRNIRLSRPTRLGPLLFRAEGRERQDRGVDLERLPWPNAVQAA